MIMVDLLIKLGFLQRSNNQELKLRPTRGVISAGPIGLVGAKLTALRPTEGRNQKEENESPGQHCPALKQFCLISVELHRMLTINKIP